MTAASAKPDGRAVVIGGGLLGLAANANARDGAVRPGAAPMSSLPTYAEEVAEEIRKLQIRQQYLTGKVAYWDARLNGDLELAEQIAAQNQEIAKELK